MEALLTANEDSKMTEKQQKIIRAAIEIFSEKGYSGSSTSEIASKAGVAEGTIFRHYKTKKDLLLSIVAPMMLNLMAPMLMREFAKVVNAPYGSFEEFLKAVIRNRLEFVRGHLPLVKILLQEIPFHDDLRQSFKDIVAKHAMDHVVRAVEHFQRQGAIVDVPPRTAIRFVIANVFGLIMTMLFLLPELDWNEEEEIERTIRLMMHGLAP